MVFDILLCMAKGINKETYLHKVKSIQVDENSFKSKEQTCNVLWNHLHKLQLKIGFDIY